MSECDVCHTPLEVRGTRIYCPACMLKSLWDDDDAMAETLELEEITPQPTPVPQEPGLPLVPRHRLMNKLGEGGFAVVYQALQLEPVRREVAVKVLRANIATAAVLARFEAERQTLARMEHPGIARLWDAGQTADGQPFFAMELVRGSPVTSFCKTHQLSLRDRLQLFIAICEAVQHAHEKGVLHRDLKPSNLLVSEDRQVKVIDFGIAKALQTTEDADTPAGPATSVHQTVGTPGYMSPEQAEWGAQHVDARSDIYALGVVLYELLTARTPLQVERTTNSDARRHPVASIITPPSKLASSIARSKNERRDLDAIVLKALEHESTLRYASAASLADDVRRHLADQPVDAGHQSLSYVMQKFARRHRGLVLSACITLAAIIAGFTISTILFFREQRALSRTDAALTRVKEREHDLSRTLSRADFNAAQRYKEISDYQSAAASLSRALASDPEFSAAGADLQTLLAYADFFQPVNVPIKVKDLPGKLQSVRVSSEGRLVVGHFKQGVAERLVIWRAVDDHWESEELPQPDGIRHYSLSGTGHHLAVADMKNQLRVHLLQGSRSAPRVWKCPAPITALNVQARQGSIFVGCNDGSVWFFDGISTEGQSLFKAGAPVVMLNGNGSGNLIVAGCQNGEVHRWRPGTTSTRILKLRDVITAIALGNQGNQVAAGDLRGFVAAALPDNTNAATPVRLHMERITALAIASSDTLISAGRDLRLRWVDLATGADRAAVLETAGQIERIAVDRAAEEATLLAADASVRLWKRSSGTALTLRKPQHARFLALSSPGSMACVLRDEGESIEMRSLASHMACPMVLAPGERALAEAGLQSAMSFGSKSTQLLTLEEEGTPLHWQTADATQLKAQGSIIGALAMAGLPDGRYALALRDGSLVDFDPATGTTSDVLKPELMQVLSPLADFRRWDAGAVSPDGQAAVWCDLAGNNLEECMIRIYERKSGKLSTFHSQRLSAIAINAQQRIVILGLRNGVVRVHHIGDFTQDLSLHLSRVSSVACTNDGRCMVTGSTDGTIGLWDPLTGKPLSGYLRIGEPVQGVAVSTDGTRFAGATENHAWVGDIATASIIGPRFDLPRFAGQLALNEDGSRMAVSLPGTSCFVYQIAAPTTAPPPAWFHKMVLACAARNYTYQRVLEVTEQPTLTAILDPIPDGPSRDQWHTFASWLVAAPGQRTLTPWTDLTLEAYLQNVFSRPGPAAELERRRHLPALQTGAKVE